MCCSFTADVAKAMPILDFFFVSYLDLQAPHIPHGNWLKKPTFFSASVVAARYRLNFRTKRGSTSQVLSQLACCICEMADKLQRNSKCKLSFAVTALNNYLLELFASPCLQLDPLVSLPGYFKASSF